MLNVTSVFFTFVNEIKINHKFTSFDEKILNDEPQNDP